MNTFDIRNMEIRQWAYWASAIPLTLLVMGLSLVAIRYLERIRHSWSDTVYRRETDAAADSIETRKSKSVIARNGEYNLARRPPFESNAVRHHASERLEDRLEEPFLHLRQRTKPRPHQRSAHRRYNGW